MRRSSTSATGPSPARRSDVGVLVEGVSHRGRNLGNPGDGVVSWYLLAGQARALFDIAEDPESGRANRNVDRRTLRGHCAAGRILMDDQSELIRCAASPRHLPDSETHTVEHRARFSLAAPVGTQAEEVRDARVVSMGADFVADGERARDQAEDDDGEHYRASHIGRIRR